MGLCLQGRLQAVDVRVKAAGPAMSACKAVGLPCPGLARRGGSGVGAQQALPADAAPLRSAAPLKRESLGGTLAGTA